MSTLIKIKYKIRLNIKFFFIIVCKHYYILTTILSQQKIVTYISYHTQFKEKNNKFMFEDYSILFKLVLYKIIHIQHNNNNIILIRNKSSIKWILLDIRIL